MLFQSVLLLPVVHIALIVLGYSRACAAMERLIPLKHIDRQAFGTETIQRAQEIARIVSIAAQHGVYRATCLRRSLLTWWFLRREGIESKICFGVRTFHGKLEAHAWVEYDGVVLNDSASVHKNFQALHEVLPSTYWGL